MKIESAEQTARQLLNNIGLDLRRYRPERSESGRLATMLAHHDVDLVFDVGANTGQFARSLRRAGYPGRIVSFEPLSLAHHKLVKASTRDPSWTIAPRMAIGDHEGKMEIHISGNSVSSSLLKMLDAHSAAAPESSYVNQESVTITRLDRIAADYTSAGSVPFIKIDTQGYEDRVLNGASEFLKASKGLQLELSIVPLYEGQELFDPLVSRLRGLGFSIWAIWPGFCDPRSGRMLQVDVTFFRE
jgi:FkbM family methyltransferase